jgi:hypothetical protein
MALQSSGSISLKQIGQEFDLTPPYKLSDVNKMMNRHPKTNKKFTDFYGVTMASNVPVLFSDNDSSVSTMINTNTPPSVQDIFDTWARTDGSAYYTNKTVASGQALDWQLLSNPDRILMPTNTSLGNGFISPDQLDTYTFEATVRSDSIDDDRIGLIAAFTRSTGQNEELIITRTQGGAPPSNGWGAQYVSNGEPHGWIIHDVNIDGVNKNGYSGDKQGWNNRYSRIRIERNGDIIKAWCSNWNSEVIREDSLITIDLNSDSRLHKFKGPQSYGYYTYSQDNSTYLDVKLKGAVDLGSIFDTTNGNYYYSDGGAYSTVNSTIQQEIGYINRIVNPLNFQTSIIQSDFVEHIKYWVGKETSQNMLDYESWPVTSFSTGYEAKGFRLNGSVNENSIINDTDPFGNTAKIWRASGNDTSSNADGGWNTIAHRIDSNKLYRKTIWVKRVTLGNGSFYLGTHGDGHTSGIYRLSDGSGPNNNPYFVAGSWDLELNKWYLVVGHVHPYDTAIGTQHPDSGWYEVGNPNKIASLAYGDYKWHKHNTNSYHRTYLYYSTDPSTDQRWCYPRFEEINGFEPSIDDLVNGFEESRAPQTCKSCLEWKKLGYDTSGIYRIHPDSIPGGMDVYCDMVTDGGGWTLVWSHILNKANYPVNNLTWDNALNSYDLRDGNPVSTSLTSFQVYTGLNHWDKIGAAQLRYDWSANANTTIDQQAIMTGINGSVLGTEAAYRPLTLDSMIQPIGTVIPGIFSYHNGRPFSATDADHDDYPYNCPDYYGQTPWWYRGCWSGSINGGGGESYTNGAYWNGSRTTINASTGDGGGNGWLYIR